MSKLFGVADTHVHFMAHLAAAGYFVWGKPHAGNPATTGVAGQAECLAHCDSTEGHGAGGALPSLDGLGHRVGGFPEFDGWPQNGTLAHQKSYIDWIRRAYDGGLRLVVCLAVNSEMLAKRCLEFPGYGGLLRHGIPDISDMTAVRVQIEAMKRMRDFVDAQSGGPGHGWLQIANSAAEARDIVGANKLCMVMGVEVDSLGNWRTPRDLVVRAQSQGVEPAALIADLVEELFSQGVRHFFPLHGTNNAFGGAGIFLRNYDAANFLATGASFQVERADPALGISYRLDQDQFPGGKVAEILAYHGVQEALNAVLGGAGVGAAFAGLVGAGAGVAAVAALAGSILPCPPKPVNWNQPNADPALDTSIGGHINAQGLTEFGELLVHEIGKRGGLIDVDHMGEKTSDRVLSLCEAVGYPIVSGHTCFRELRYGNGNETFNGEASAATFGTANGGNLSREVDKSPAQLARIKNLGGFVSCYINPSEGLPCRCSQWQVANDSAQSSKSLAQGLLYAHAKMEGRNVGIGSDITGAGTLPGARFGPNASWGLRDAVDQKAKAFKGESRRTQTLAQNYGVKYSTNPREYRFTRFVDDAKTLPGAPFTEMERDFWQALVLNATGITPASADWTGKGPLDGGHQARIVNLAAGLLGPTALSQIMPAPLIVGDGPLQWAAFNVTHGTTTNDTHIIELMNQLQPAWQNWQQMAASGPNLRPDWLVTRLSADSAGLYDNDGRLTRATAGGGARVRDFDINIDGMAHYGLLPDLFQDLWNIGVPDEVMGALYSSANDFIETWELCESRRTRWNLNCAADAINSLLC